MRLKLISGGFNPTAQDPQMSQKETTKEAKPNVESELSTGLRPIGVSFSSLTYAIAGIYYLAYTQLQDPTLIPLYLIGSLSLIGSFGLMRMTKWGLWLGLLLYPPQIIAPTYALLVTLQLPDLTTSYIVIPFAASLVALIFLATLSFLFVLDKRKSFK